MLIPKGVLALRNVAASEKTRYAINGVLIERKDGRARATATDGKMLAMVTWDDEKPESIDSAHAFGIPAESRESLSTVLPSEALARAEKAIPKDKATKARKPFTQLVALNETPRERGAFELSTVDATLSPTVSTVTPVDGHFPPVDDVLPKEGAAGVIRIGLNAELLFRLAQTLSAAGASFGASPSDHVILEIKDAHSAVCVRAFGRTPGADVRGVLMPVNIGDESAEREPARKAPPAKPRETSAMIERREAEASAGSTCNGCGEAPRAVPSRDGLCNACADTLERKVA
jgi:hypothetical protein